MELSELIHVVENEFTNLFDISLFSNTPASQIAELSKPVNNLDEFKARIFSYCAIFDHLNKKSMDRISKVKTAGTRLSFETFLKFKMINEQTYIDDKIIRPISLLCLLRDYLAHGKNKNKEKAINYFNLNDPIDNYVTSWKNILSVYESILHSILFLIRSSDHDFENSIKINKNTELSLVKQFFADFSFYFENKKTNAILREIIESGPIKDTSVANIFNIELIELRRLLYPFINKLITSEYSSINETIISLKPYYYEFKNLLFDEMRD
ncbi:MAG: hypothetical protein PF574_00015 [Candidatus Delongbacteria bacterium]|nr:hypothetical protein [Candidatus Delongbacteria bacterium]